MIHLASLRSGKFQGNCTNAIALGKVRRMLLPSVLAPPPRLAGARQMFDPDAAACI